MVASVLHVGCGFKPLPAWLDGPSETRLDIDPACQPDITGSMTDLGDIGFSDVKVYRDRALNLVGLARK